MKVRAQLLLIASWVIWAILFFALILILVNPRWQYKTTETSNQSEVHLYLDESASMYDKLNPNSFSALAGFVEQVESLWAGEVKLWYFADELRSARTQEDGNGIASAFREELRFTRMPTQINSVEERLFFADSTHFHFIISDFRFRDGFRDFNGLKGITNIFYIPPSSAPNKSSLTDESVNFEEIVSAGFFLNPERSGLGSTPQSKGFKSSSVTPVILDVLFYSDDADAILSYELNVLTREVLESSTEGIAPGVVTGKALKELNLNRQVLKRGKVKLTDHYQKSTWEIKLPADVIASWQKGWIQLGLEVKKQVKDSTARIVSYGDQVNLLPQGNALRVNLISFGVNKNTFLIKNSLDRYDAYEVESTYLGVLTSQRNQQGELSDQKRMELEARLNALVADSDLFILVAPPLEALAFFSANAKKPATRKAYLHIPSGTRAGTKLQVNDLDFSAPPINFLDDNVTSRDHWQKSLLQMNGLVLPLAPSDIAFHKAKTGTSESSAFFIRGYEVYLGIENLFFLNQNLLADEETSFADLFWVKLINYVNDKLIKSEEESAHNYFLGEVVIESGLRKNLIHLYENQEGVFISPSLSHSGAYFSSRKSPPYTYRIPLEEYFPPPVNVADSLGGNFLSYEKALAFLENIENIPAPLITRETTLRESSYYSYLIIALLLGFLLLLMNKWLMGRMG